MTRHARNNTASAVYSYHERQRDTKSSGYGTQKARLAKDSVKDFDACNLTLQPCRNPIVTLVHPFSKYFLCCLNKCEYVKDSHFCFSSLGQMDIYSIRKLFWSTLFTRRRKSQEK